MIVLLSKRHRNSRRLIREFFLNFIRLELSVGTIDQTIREAARSVAPLEEELIREIEEAALLMLMKPHGKKQAFCAGFGFSGH